MSERDLTSGAAPLLIAAGVCAILWPVLSVAG